MFEKCPSPEKNVKVIRLRPSVLVRLDLRIKEYRLSKALDFCHNIDPIWNLIEYPRRRCHREYENK